MVLSKPHTKYIFLLWTLNELKECDGKNTVLSEVASKTALQASWNVSNHTDNGKSVYLLKANESKMFLVPQISDTNTISESSEATKYIF